MTIQFDDFVRTSQESIPPIISLLSPPKAPIFAQVRVRFGKKDRQRDKEGS